MSEGKERDTHGLLGLGYPRIQAKKPVKLRSLTVFVFEKPVKCVQQAMAWVARCPFTIASIHQFEQASFLIMMSLGGGDVGLHMVYRHDDLVHLRDESSIAMLRKVQAIL